MSAATRPAAGAGSARRLRREGAGHARDGSCGLQLHNDCMFSEKETGENRYERCLPSAHSSARTCRAGWHSCCLTAKTDVSAVTRASRQCITHINGSRTHPNARLVPG